MKRTLLVSVATAAVAIGAIAVAVPYGADYYARVSIEKMFQRARDGGAKVATYSSVKTNIWDGEVVLHGVVLESTGENSSTLKIDTFRTHFPWEFNGTLSAGLVQASNLQIASGGITYILPEARIADFVFRSKEKIDTVSPVKSFLKRMDASEVTATEWKTIQEGSGERTVTGLEIQDIEHGKAATLHFSGLGATMKGVDNTTVTMATGEGTYTDIDLAGIAAVYTDRGTADQPMEKLLGKVEIKSFQAKDLEGKDSGTITIDSMSMEDMQGRPMREPFSAYMELNARISQQKPEEMSPADTKLLSELTADIFTGFSLGKMDATGIKIENRKESGAFSIGKMALENFANGVTGKFVIENIALNDKKVEEFSIGSFSFTNMDINPSLKFLSVMANASTEGEDKAVDDLASRVFTAIPTFSRISVENFSAKKPDFAFGFDSFSIDTSNHVQGLPLKTTIALKGVKELQTSAEQEPLPFKETLKEMGFENPVVDYGVSYEWNESSSTVMLSDTIALLQGGKIDVNTGVANIDKKVFAGTLDGDILPALLEGSVQPLSVTFKDDGLTQKLIGYFSKQASIEPDAFRAMIKMQATEFNTAFGAPLDEQSMSKIQAFLDKPSSITVVFTPQQEMTPLDLYTAYSMEPASLLTQFKASVK